MARTKNPNPKRKVQFAESQEVPQEVPIEDIPAANPIRKRRRIVVEDEKDDHVAPVLPPDEQDLEEVVIIDSSSSKDNCSSTILRILVSSPDDDGESSVNTEWKLLKDYSLSDCSIEFCYNSNTNQKHKQPAAAQQQVVLLKTALGATRLIQHVLGRRPEDNDDDMSTVALGLALEQDGTLAVAIQSNKLSIYLTSKAFVISSPPQLPMETAKRRTAQRFRPSQRLQQVFALLFPDDFDHANTRNSASVNPITAKTVYQLLDNHQLHRYEEQNAKGGNNNDPKVIAIRGLVPTLRPYQEAAVRWMLEREQGHDNNDNNNNDDEWELAWWVLSKDKWLPLSKEYKSQGESLLFYCPFAAWLVSSYAQAQEATQGTTPPLVRGGILAESMGLGKTVEVIACLLAHKYVAKTTTATPLPRTNGEGEGRNQEETETAIISAPSTPTRPPPTRPPTNSRMTTNRYGVCICGKSEAFKDCLSFVLCESCREPMHGVCAGFECMEQVVSETTVDHVGNSPEIIRLCSREKCPSCTYSMYSKNLIESRATLIVTPPAILDQWEREIRRHSSVPVRDDTPVAVSPLPKSRQSLKVVVYPGIRNLYRNRPGTLNGNLKRPECHLIHPQILADADVVLMTFDSLMGDLGHSDDNPYIEDGPSRLRARKKYRVVPSPLSCIKWWRICLDEAQRVEQPTATSAKMALKLSAQHRWCVSGTPIGRGKLDDLYGLLLFLRLSPFSSKAWFQNCLQPGSRGVLDRVARLLQHIMWRSTKASDSVRKQMGIPLQVEKKTVLKFSSVERHFYNRQLEQTMLAATDVIGATKVTRKRKSTKLEILTHQIHRLRAACCHPQVGSMGLGKPNKNRTIHTPGVHANSTVSVSSGVLSMEQILDRLIDDTKLQCEESQRLVVMHTNAMAALSRLKVEAKHSGSEFSDADESLLKKSCDLYEESLNITEQNASPCTVVGEAVLTGCQGFITPHKIIRNGRSPVQWMIRPAGNDSSLREVWARFDFDIGKKLTQIKVQPLTEIPEDFKDCTVLYPHECTFQAAHTALGGEFVDVVSFSINKTETPKVLGGFRTNKSKAWRFVVKSFHDFEHPPGKDLIKCIVGVNVELFEPDIASDSLQRLHVLHNTALSMMSLEELCASEKSESKVPLPARKYSLDEIRADCQNIESLYLGAARNLHTEIKRELKEAQELRLSAMASLADASEKGTKRRITDPWTDLWWEDVLSNCFLNGGPHEKELLCDRVQQSIESFSASQIGIEYKTKHPGQNLPDFLGVGGLQTGLRIRVDNFLSEIGSNAHGRCMEKFSKLSSSPKESEQVENSHCGKCHVDWNQTGPTCAHCKLEEELLGVEPDALIMCIFKSIWKWLKDCKSSIGRMQSARNVAREHERAEKWFDVIQASEKEWQRAKKAWKIHMDLLNDIDEVNQCKRSMRLAQIGEDLSNLTDDELNAIVVPLDIQTRYLDHGAKQAMAMGNLRRNVHTLRYLRNQDKERQQEHNGLNTDSQCILCLCEMKGERAVLSCGHSFHHTPCLERLVARQSSQALVCCPLRCSIKTKKEDIMIASDRRKDDGSQRTRDVSGSWGTKVTRLVCDLLDVSERGEKSVVFSQWEDMLWVVEQALLANHVGYTRVKSLKKIGDNIKRFRSEDCSALLLNVKNGAEGLTLVEATHVFMIEPLLNCGLDSQAISRIHRIGQTSKTYVHRYLVDDTVEGKIDRLRMDRQEDQLEDAINEARQKHDIEGGGIDGGFTKDELQDLLK